MKNICKYFTLKYLIEKNQDKLIVKFDLLNRNIKLIEEVEVS
ncbi:hypothetical protein [Clostridium sp. DL1XJH146]